MDASPGNPPTPAPPEAPAKKKGSVGRVILGVILVIVATGGLWYWNDSSAVDETNKCVEKWNSTITGFQAAQYASKPSDVLQAIRPSIDHIIQHKGGRGPLHFLTRDEVSQRAAELHRNAGAMLLMVHLLEGDIAGARAALEAYKKIKASYSNPEPGSAVGLVSLAEKLLSTEGIDKMPPETLKAALWSGMGAAMSGK